MKVCATGHRKIPADIMDFVRNELRKEIMLAINNGYTHFISGFADGADLIFAEIVAETKAEHTSITLEAAIPYRNRLKAKNDTFQRLIKLCDKITVVTESYRRDCYMLRNLYMLENSELVIGVYDGREGGGTAFTLRQAKRKYKEVRVVLIGNSTNSQTV